MINEPSNTTLKVSNSIQEVGSLWISPRDLESHQLI